MFKQTLKIPEMLDASPTPTLGVWQVVSRPSVFLHEINTRLCLGFISRYRATSKLVPYRCSHRCTAQPTTGFLQPCPTGHRNTPTDYNRAQTPQTGGTQLECPQTGPQVDQRLLRHKVVLPSDKLTDPQGSSGDSTGERLL